MSDENKIENETEAQVDDGVISLDDLDSILAEEDPQFVEEMSAISSDQTLKDANVEPMDFVEFGDEKSLPTDLIDTNSSDETKNSNVFKVAISRIKKNLSNIYRDFQIKISYFKVKIFNFIKYEIPKLGVLFFSVAKKSGSFFIQGVKSQWMAISSLSVKNKTGIIVLLVFTLGIVFGVYLSFKKNWIPQIYKPLHKSISELANFELSIENSSRWMSLYRAFPQPEYFVLLDKVVVNLKRSHPFENPMTVIEFYLELDSQDTAVEISDRKSHVLDATQRAVEEFTYNEIQTKPGLLKLKALVRSEVNNILNQGRVTKVYINTIVTKK